MASFSKLVLASLAVYAANASNCRNSEPITWGTWTKKVLQKSCKGFDVVNVPGVTGFVWKEISDETELSIATHVASLNVTTSLNPKPMKLQFINAQGTPYDNNQDPSISGVLNADLLISKLNMNYTAQAERYEYFPDNDTFIVEFPVHTTIDTDIQWINDFFALTPEAQFLNFHVKIIEQDCTNDDALNPQCHRLVTVKNKDLVLVEKTYRLDYYSDKCHGFHVDVREVSQICPILWPCHYIPYYRGTLYLDGVMKPDGSCDVRNIDMDEMTTDIDVSQMYWKDANGTRTDFGQSKVQLQAIKNIQNIVDNQVNPALDQIRNSGSD